jgi:hypothetical protein
LKQIQNETDKILVKGKFAGHPKLPTIVRANDSIWLGLRSDNRHIKDVTSNTLMALDRSVAHVILQAMKWRQGLKTMCCCYLRSHTSRASMNGRCVTPRGRTKEKETKQKRRPRKSTVVACRETQDCLHCLLSTPQSVSLAGPVVCHDLFISSGFSRLFREEGYSAGMDSETAGRCCVLGHGKEQ